MAPVAPARSTLGAVTDPLLPAAVLWDMDGTIIDTEPYWMAEEERLVHEAGGTWSTQDSLDLVGNDLRDSAAIILERTPVTGTPEQVVDQLLSGVVARTRDHVPWRPGARELLEECVARGVPTALVTMSWTSLADVLLQALPPATFTTVVTGDGVSRGKPHPDPYLEAARRLRVAPAQCLALEDSPTGARSSTAAGVPTVAVPHIVAVPEMAGLTTLPSLAGVGLERLAGLWRDLRDQTATGSAASSAGAV